MIGSFLTRGLVMVLGYVYPAYECYKTVEMNRPEIEQLRFWCQYWILVAVLTVCERIGDAFISWVPMYSEAKLAFFIYLWYPKTKGTTYVYDSFFKPYVAKHETEIDRNLLELRTRAGDFAVLYWQRAASFGQTRLYDIVQYFAAQSTPRPRAQPQRVKARKPHVPADHQASTGARMDTEESASSSASSSTSSEQRRKDGGGEAGPSQVPPPTSTAVVSKALKAAPPPTSTALVSRALKAAPPTSTAAVSNALYTTVPPDATCESMPTEAEPMPIEPAPATASENGNPPPPPPQKETVLDEGRVAVITRGRLRKTRSAPNR